MFIAREYCTHMNINPARQLNVRLPDHDVPFYRCNAQKCSLRTALEAFLTRPQKLTEFTVISRFFFNLTDKLHLFHARIHLFATSRKTEIEEIKKKKKRKELFSRRSVS